MKKRLIILLTVMSLILLPVLANADAAVTSNADILNKLAILRGNGTDYHLDGQLTRSEAITFIVRVLGKESYVQANAAKYSVPTFNDVSAADWFTSSVEYCVEQNIVKGFPDGGFHPNDSISEKAFLKLVLNVLGYKDAVDFAWDSVFATAFNVGLVSDVKYKTQAADNNNYKRSDVVNVLYNALTKAIKGSTKTLVDTLLDAQIVDRSVFVQLGFAKEIIPTKIENSQVVDGNSLTVNFNQSLKTLTDADIKIYETANTTNTLAVSVKTQADKTVTIKTSPQKADVDYTAEITTIDAATGTQAVVTTNFKGFKIPEIQSNFFKISKVVPVSKNVINVYFTQPVSSIATFPTYYEIYKNNVSFIKGSLSNMNIRLLSIQNNVVSIYLKNDTITEDASYNVKISGDIVSNYGVQLNDGVGDSAAFSSSVLDNDIFSITKIYPADSRTLRVEFNKEVDLTTALQPTNYQLTTTSGVLIGLNRATIANDGAGKAILLNIAGLLDKGLSYQLTVNNIMDNNNIMTMASIKYPFYGIGLLDHKDLQVQLITSLDKSTLKVYFDRSVDAASAASFFNYSIVGITDPSFTATPVSVFYDPKDPTTVKLFLPPGKEIVSPNTYKLSVLNTLLDSLGNPSTSNAVINFNGIYSSNQSDIKPMINDAVIIGKNTIKVKTQKEIMNSGLNLISSNYSLQTKDVNNSITTKTPSSISVIDGTTMVLKFDTLDFTKAYTLTYSTLTDFSGLNIRTSSDGFTSIGVRSGN